MWNKFLYVIFLTLFAFSPAAIADVIEHNYYFQTPMLKYEIFNGEKVATVRMPGLKYLSELGEPEVPFKTAKILLPQGHDVSMVDVITKDKTLLAKSVKLIWGQPKFPIGHKQIYFVGPDESVYNSENLYPAQTFELLSVQNYLGARIAIIRIYPVRYVGRSGEVWFTKSITLRVETKPTKNLSQVLGFRGLASDVKRISSFVDNPDLIKTYRLSKKSSTTYDYVIITSSSLSSAFNTFKTHRESQGLSVLIKTVESISSEYTGRDLAEKIRNFLIYAYQNYNTSWALLGGDADCGSGNNIVPTRQFYCNTEWEADYLAADIYYACLDGNFDYDNDNIFAEITDGPGGGEVDLLCELFVGRIAADDVTEIQKHLQKIISYESSSPMYSALLIGEILDWETCGDDYKDYVYGFMGNIPYASLYECAGTFSGSAVISAMNSNEHQMVNHIGHANNTYVMGLYNSDVDALTNSNYFFVYTQGCYSGAFDNRDDWGSCISDDSIAEHFTVNSNGGSYAYFGNSRYGWYEPGSVFGPSNYFDWEFMDAIFGEGKRRLGVALNDSREDNVGLVSSQENVYRWVYFDVNLLGCPYTEVNLNCDSGSLAVAIVNPHEEFKTAVGHETLIKVKVRDGCGAYQYDATVIASFSNGDSDLTLYDDGAHSDDAANDGIYGNIWIPEHAASEVTVSIEASKPGFTSDVAEVSGEVWESWPSVLLVDDDAGYSYEQAFSSALDALDVRFMQWSVEEKGSPSLDELLQYSIVIWTTGSDWWTTLSSQDQNNLADFIDGGGNLFLSSQDVLYDIGSTWFVRDYLHVASYEDDIGASQAIGISADPISNGLNITLNYPYTDYSDKVDPDSQAATVFKNESNYSIAVRSPSTAKEKGRVVFFAFPFEAVPADDGSNYPNNRTELMRRILAWLGGCDEDGDGFISFECGGSDCDDGDANVNPDSPEVCDGADNNCDGELGVDEVDEDGDGFMICEGDCNDANKGVNPNAIEICDDGIDNECDGLVDSEDPDCASDDDIDDDTDDDVDDDTDDDSDNDGNGCGCVL